MLFKNLCIPVLLAATSISLCCGNSNNATIVSSNRSIVNLDIDTSVRPSGLIAYIRNSTEIRLIDSNGKNDSRLWTDTSIKESLGLYDLAWRPDGKELAFSSAHEALFSFYHADIYTIRPDGSNLRRVTNSPSRNGFARYKKGSVTVTIRNNQYTFQQANASSGIFFVTMAGAEDPQMVTIAPGSSKTITFKSVADFGKNAQGIVAINGSFRWSIPGTDVHAGQSVKAPDLIITGDGIEYLGAFHPVWKQDGSSISYRDGNCIVKTIAANPPEGEFQYTPVFKNKNPLGTCTWDYGPVPSMTEQVIYTENSGETSGIFLMKEGSIHDPSKKLTQFSDISYQLLHELHWLPDGAGFLYSTVDLYREAANIFRYDLRTRQTTQLTKLNGEFARKFCISPSGKWVVYERAKTNDEDKDVDLWIMKMDGTEEKMLVKNGGSPSWSR